MSQEFQVVSDRYNNFINFLRDCSTPEHLPNILKMKEVTVEQFLTYVKNCNSVEGLIGEIKNKFNLSIDSYHKDDVQKLMRYLQYFFDVSLLN